MSDRVLPSRIGSLPCTLPCTPSRVSVVDFPVVEKGDPEFLGPTVSAFVKSFPFIDGEHSEFLRRMVTAYLSRLLKIINRGPPGSPVAMNARCELDYVFKWAWNSSTSRVLPSVPQSYQVSDVGNVVVTLEFLELYRRMACAYMDILSEGSHDAVETFREMEYARKWARDPLWASTASWVLAPPSFPADVRIDMPNEVHDIVLMPNVSSRASNSAPATPLFPWCVSSQSSIMTQDVPFGTHFDHPGISNVAASISEKHHDVSASEASNGANAGSEISDDNSSLEASNEVNAGPEIHDHSAPTLIPDISARDIKFLFELNAVIAGITGQAVFNLVASTSTDSPYLRCCAATAGVGFFGSFLAICSPRNQKQAKILSKIGAIGAASAVSIALGITVLKDTKWYVNVVATGMACLLSTAVVVKAN